MNEHSFIKSIHRTLPSDLLVWKIHDTYAGGVPDAMYAGNAGTLWVEYKYVPALPKRDSTLIKTTLKPLQLQWLNKLHMSNQKAALIVGIEDTALILLVNDWTANITKEYYIEHKVNRSLIKDFIICSTMQG